MLVSGRSTYSERIILPMSLLLLLTYWAAHSDIILNCDGLRYIRVVLSSVIYMGIFILWSFSLRKRLLPSAVRTYLLTTSWLIILWVLIRCLKYNFSGDVEYVKHLLWYGFYIPIQLLPVMGLFSAIQVGKPDRYILPLRVRLILVPSLIFILLFLTNDIHQGMFYFTGQTYEVGDYGYTRLFFLSEGWIFLVTVVAIVILLRKCRIPRSNRILWPPIAVFVLIFIYCSLYILQSRFPIAETILGFFLHDITLMISYLVVLLWESVIGCHLIRTNQGYERLFYDSGIPMAVCDREFHIRFQTGFEEDFSVDTLKMALKEPHILDSGYRLCGNAISGGYLFWLEDISPVLETIAQLNEVKDALEDSNYVMQEEYRMELRRQRIAARQKLYDRINRETADQIGYLNRLIEEYEKAARPDMKAREKEAGPDEKEYEKPAEPDRKRRIMAKIAVVGAYMKRRRNLILIGEQQRKSDIRELELAFQEIADCMALLGIDFACHIQPGETCPVSCLVDILDRYEKVTEPVLDDLQAVFVTIRKEQEKLVCVMEAERNQPGQPIREVIHFA